jgi:hypothetical protein
MLAHALTTVRQPCPRPKKILRNMFPGTPKFWNARNNGYGLDQSLSTSQRYNLLYLSMYKELPTSILILRIKSGYAQAMLGAVYIGKETEYCMIFFFFFAL